MCLHVTPTCPNALATTEAYVPSSEPLYSTHLSPDNLFLRPRPRHPSPDDTRQLLLPDAKQQPDAPAHRRRKHNAQPCQQPELRADILLLTRWPAPVNRLRPTLAVCSHCLRAFAYEAIDLFVLAELGGVFLVGCAMAGAVACGGVGGFEGGVANGEDGGEGTGAGGDVLGGGGGLRGCGREERERFFGWGLGAAGELSRRGV